MLLIVVASTTDLLAGVISHFDALLVKTISLFSLLQSLMPKLSRVQDSFVVDTIVATMSLWGEGIIHLKTQKNRSSRERFFGSIKV